MRTKIEMEFLFRFPLSGIYWQLSRPDNNKFDIPNGRGKRVIPNGFRRNAETRLRMVPCALTPAAPKPAPAFANPVLRAFFRGVGK